MGEQHQRHRLNVIGPFYVVDGCCTACGVPDAIAPELFGADDDVHCYVARQPQSSDEIDAMVDVMHTQELGCVRYAGADEALLRRLAENGEAELCDVAPPPDAVPIRRDHVVFSATTGTGPWTPRTILLGLLGSLPDRWDHTNMIDEGTMATVSLAWFEDDFHRVDVLASHERGEWLIRHHGPPGLSQTLHAWLTKDGAFEQVRWQTEAQWQVGGPSRPTPM